MASPLCLGMLPSTAHGASLSWAAGAPALCLPLKPLCVSRPLLLVHVLCVLQGSGWQAFVEVFILSLESDWSPSGLLSLRCLGQLTLAQNSDQSVYKGTFLEVPDPGMSSYLELCWSLSDHSIGHQGQQMFAGCEVGCCETPSLCL